MRICEKHEHQDSSLPCPVPGCLEGPSNELIPSWAVVDSEDTNMLHRYVRERAGETWVWKHIGCEHVETLPVLLNVG